MNAGTGGSLYPFSFHPLLKERVWGGRKLEQLYHKPLPPGVLIGESWEISDRPGESSVIANGPLAGHSLHWLLENHGAELLGKVPAKPARFPLLIKILDAREKLSLQVHPPADKAAALGGEPKTELWYIAQAEPGAELYAGLKAGVSRPEFERAVASGTVAECFHRIPVQAGDAMFLPSGRVHALGAGLVIYEIQQNSDTTYRVFDWNRAGLDGKPRTLHLEESLASIDFTDIEPSLVRSGFSHSQPVKVRTLARDPLFEVELCQGDPGGEFPLPASAMQILGVVAGRVKVLDGQSQLLLSAGQFLLIPASLPHVRVQIEVPVTFLRAQAGREYSR